ncbi:MAG: primosomal protein N' [bacterium]
MKLTAEQQQALDAINSSAAGQTFLLYGVTGSGKTEVYMQAIANVLTKGKSAIVLVPEIALTPQMIERFTARFGEQCAVLHSHLTVKNRREEWEAVASGVKRIVLGARSAVFAPVKDLGIIVIDEEFENSYKQDKSPRYHVREVAEFIVKQHGAVLVLGTATPSIETFYKAEQGAFKKLTLSQRIDNRPLPPVEIIDMRQDKGFILSERLKEELKVTLERKEQAILFINRRGYFTFIMCKDCGKAIECPTCSVSLTYHSEDKHLLCGHCGYSTDSPHICPHCQGSSVQYFGIGTQRIEQEVADYFPQARILRYDSDAVTKRGSHETLFNTFAEGKADILIGTQMVAKGLDVANVTLVGVVAADTALNLPDFRAAERTFQLITQVAGRAGRHHLPGKVIVQTYSPEHFALQTAVKHDYDAFYQAEIKHRQELNYPPYSQLIGIVVSGEARAKVIKVIQDIKTFLDNRQIKGVMGPAPAVIARLRGDWRYRLLLKSSKIQETRNKLQEIMSKIVIPSDVRVVVDVEPISLL